RLQGDWSSDVCSSDLGFFGTGGVFEHGIDEHGDGLRHAVEDEQLVGDEKAHHGGLYFVMRRAGDDGLDVMDEFVADEPDGAAGEPGQTEHGDRAVFFHDALDDGQAVLDALRTVGLGGGADEEGFDDL